MIVDSTSRRRMNSECRRPKPEKRPKSEDRKCAACQGWPPGVVAGPSDFGFRASFGFRHSAFGFPHDPCRNLGLQPKFVPTEHAGLAERLSVEQLRAGAA